MPFPYSYWPDFLGVGGGSADTLSGCAEALHYIYNEIGGCVFGTFFVLLLPYLFLIFFLPL